MSLPTFEELYARADDRREPARVVVMGGADLTVLQALSKAVQRGWVSPKLAGNRADIERIATQHSIDLKPFEILDTDQPGSVAVAEIREGRGDVLMKGRISTPDLMRAILSRENGLRTDHTIGQVVLMEVGPRSVLMADTGVTTFPTREQKISILQSTAETAHRLGVPTPKIAIMSATEKPTDALPDSIEAVELTAAHREKPFADCDVQGPLSFDLAWDTEASQRKDMGGNVVGAADAMVFPDLLSANLTVKAMMYTAPCRFGGNLFGVRCPVVFMSRADSPETRLNSLAFALTSDFNQRSAL